MSFNPHNNLWDKNYVNILKMKKLRIKEVSYFTEVKS